MPGNTIAVFQRSIKELEDNDNYKYSECDLRETKDHQIVVFHDWDIGKLVPDAPANRKAIGVEKITDFPTNDLALKHLKALRLDGEFEIPTLEEVLQCAVELKIEKPLLLEIKVLNSDAGRSKVFELAKKYRDHSGIEIHFSDFRRNISRSFPDERLWLKRFADSGF